MVKYRSFTLPVLLALAFTLASVGGAQELDTIIFLPDTMGYLDDPFQILPNPVTGHVYVVSTTLVLVFDPASREKVGVIERDFFSGAAFCPDVSKVYLMSEEPCQLLVIDAHTNTLVDSIPLGGEGLEDIAYSRESAKLYVARYDLCPVVVDATADTVIGEIGVLPETEVLVWDSVHNRMLIAEHGGAVAAVDCTNDSVVAVVNLLTTSEALALNPGRNKLYVGGEDSLLVVDTELLQQSGSVPVLGEFYRLMYNPVNDRVYAYGTVSGQRGLAIVSCGSDTIQGFVPFEDNDFANDLAFSSTTGHVYVARDDTSGVTVIGNGDTIVGELFTGNQHDFWSLGTDPDRDELYCGMSSDTISIVDTRADTVTGHMDYVRFSVRGMVFNPAGRKLYLLSSARDAIQVMGPDHSVVGYMEFTRLDSDAFPIIHPGLNRLYVPDRDWLRVIDCNTDQVLDSLYMYGIRDPIAVLHPDLNKLYVFPEDGRAHYRRIWVYDCLRNEFLDSLDIDEETPCVAYHPRSGHIYFAGSRTTGVMVLDPHADSVVDTIETGHYTTNGRMLADLDRDRVYYYNEKSNLLHSIDVTADTMYASAGVNQDIDTIIWSRRYSKLYLCRLSTSTGRTYVFDCLSNAVVDSFPDITAECGFLNESNDKLYLGTTRGITVIDCRTDSVIARLPEMSVPRCAVGDMAENKVFFTPRGPWYAVYQDGPIGIGESGIERLGFGLGLLGNPARGRVHIRYLVPPGLRATLQVFDAVGRRVLSKAMLGRQVASTFAWNRKDAAGLSVPAGVYLVRLDAPGFSDTKKLVIQK